MKRIIAMLVAVSVTISSLQITSFAAEESVSTESAQCSGENMTLECLKDLGFTKSEAKKMMFCYESVKRAEKIKDTSGIDILSRVQSQCTDQLFDSNKGNGLLGKLTSIMSWGGGIVGLMLFQVLYQCGYNSYKKLKAKYEAGKIETAVDPVTTMKILDAMMCYIKGQEKAKSQIRSIVLNIVDKNAQYAANPNKKSKKAGPGATVIYMVGPSGVGKSFSADLMRKVLSGVVAEPFVIEASDIDRASSSSPSEQLFGMRIKRVDQGREINEYSPFILRIKAIPNSVIIINEYDKMHTPELDEKLRTIIDQGYLNVNGEKIDCSAATFIITSNESTGSVHKGNLESDNVDDGTGSRTFITHDKAFLNRIKLIEFENLSASEYKEIAAVPLARLIARYKQQYKIDIDLNGTIDSVAQKVAELNKGARPIFDYVDRLNDKLLNEVVLNNLNNNDNEVRYKVSFDNTTEEFSLEKIENESANDMANVA